MAKIKSEENDETNLVEELPFSCDQFSNCKMCSESQLGCHWCGDSLNGQCYSKYNYLACVWSTSCGDLDKCVRHQPEFVGPASRANDLRYGLLAFSLWCFFFLPLILRRWIVGTVSQRFVKNADSDGLEQPLLEESNRRSDKVTKTKIFFFFFDLFCGLIGLVVLFIIVLLVYISPQAPDFSVCTSELSFTSFIDTFEKFNYQVQGDYILQASIYNPNRFDLSLERCVGDFSYNGVRIGSYQVDWRHHRESPARNHVTNRTGSILVPGGSIFDILFVTKLDIPFSTALTMAEDYRNTKNLILEVGTSATVGINYGPKMMYKFDYDIAPSNISLSDLDVKRCKCKLSP